MKPWMIALTAVGILLAAQFARTQPAEPVAELRGKYEGIGASANAVWVLDTHTGRVRKCTQEFADQAPACSAMSN